MNLVKLLKQQEGFRSKPYLCSEDFNTIGYGRNLDTNGIDEEEAEFMLLRDIDRCRADLANNLYFFDKLNSVRQDALVNMAFQLGVSGMLKFKRMLFYLDQGDYPQAANEAKNSRWAAQTPSRAEQVAKMLETGEY